MNAFLGQQKFIADSNVQLTGFWGHSDPVSWLTSFEVTAENHPVRSSNGNLTENNELSNFWHIWDTLMPKKWFSYSAGGAGGAGV